DEVITSLRSPLQGRGLAEGWLLRGQPAVDSRGKLFQLDGFEQIVAGSEGPCQRAGRGVGGTRDNDRARRLHLLVRRAVESLDEAEVEDQDLSWAHRPKGYRRVCVETHAPETASRDVGEPRVVIDHQY